MISFQHCFYLVCVSFSDGSCWFSIGLSGFILAHLRVFQTVPWVMATSSCNSSLANIFIYYFLIDLHSKCFPNVNKMHKQFCVKAMPRFGGYSWMDQPSFPLSSSTFLLCPGWPGGFLPLILYPACQQDPYVFYIFTLKTHIFFVKYYCWHVLLTGNYECILFNSSRFSPHSD